MVGQTISHDNVFAKLDEGWTSVVYTTEDTNLKRYALKCLLAEVLESDPFPARGAGIRRS